MKAMAAVTFGKPDVNQWADVPEPVVGPMDLLIEVDHAGINPVDTKIRQGGYGEAAFPLVQGYDVSGVVIQVGSSVKRFKVGQEIYGCGALNRPGGNAPHMAIDSRLVALKPKNITHAQAAAMPLVTITAWEALHKRCRLHAHDTVLIQAGGGGVGHIAIQLAKIQGSRVITTASSDEALALCKQAGADFIINYKKEDVIARVKEITGGKGCAVVFDTVGDPTFDQSMQCLGLNGQIVTILAPDTTNVRKGFRKNISLHFEYMPLAGIHGVNMEGHGEILATAAELVEAGKLKIHVSQIVDLADLAHGHHQQETGRTVGKIAVKVK